MQISREKLEVALDIMLGDGKQFLTHHQCEVLGCNYGQYPLVADLQNEAKSIILDALCIGVGEKHMMATQK